MTRPRLSLGVIGLLLSAAPSALAQTGVRLTLLDGTEITGQWAPCDRPDRIAVSTSSISETFAVNDLLSARFEKRTPKILEGDWTVTVRGNGGSVFPANIIEGGESRIRVATPFAENLSLELDRIAAIFWNRHELAFRLMDDSLSRREPATDLLLAIKDAKLRSFACSIQSISAEGGRFVRQGKSLDFSAEKAYGVVLAGRSQLSGGTVLCALGRNSVVAGRVTRTAADSISLRAFGEQDITIMLPMVQGIRFISNRVVYLSDLEPSQIDQHTLLGMEWPMRIDEAVSGEPLAISGKRFAKGIGVHAYSAITYDLADAYKVLGATIGIDDLVRPEGNVIFRIVGDGRQLYNSGTVTGRDDPLHISVNIEGVRQLTLIVEEGEGLDIGDHADWGDIRLIK